MNPLFCIDFIKFFDQDLVQHHTWCFRVFVSAFLSLGLSNIEQLLADFFVDFSVCFSRRVNGM